MRWWRRLLASLGRGKGGRDRDRPPETSTHPLSEGPRYESLDEVPIEDFVPAPVEKVIEVGEAPLPDYIMSQSTREIDLSGAGLSEHAPPEEEATIGPSPDAPVIELTAEGSVEHRVGKRPEPPMHRSSAKRYNRRRGVFEPPRRKRTGPARGAK